MATVNNTDNAPRTRRLLFISVVFAAIAAIAVAALLINIFEHKQEARNPYVRVVEINDQVDDPAIWGKQFPMEYDQYLKTVDQKRTRYGGSCLRRCWTLQPALRR